jgi:hypothetical protein
VLLAHEPRAAQNASSIRDVTAAIAQGADGAGRRQAIVRRLKAIGVEHSLQDFRNKKGVSGANIVATVKGGGSQAYFDLIRARDQQKPAFAINLDICVLTIIHTPKDASDVLNAADVTTGTLAIERLLRLLDFD